MHPVSRPDGRKGKAMYFAISEAVAAERIKDMQVQATAARRARKARRARRAGVRPAAVVTGLVEAGQAPSPVGASPVAAA
jgi:hypothetical protein